MVTVDRPAPPVPAPDPEALIKEARRRQRRRRRGIAFVLLAAATSLFLAPQGGGGNSHPSRPTAAGASNAAVHTFLTRATRVLAGSFIATYTVSPFPGLAAPVGQQ